MRSQKGCDAVEKQEVAKLYDAYAQDVFRLALSYLYNRQDAEDVCHSVFLTLVEKDITLFPGSEKAWLLKCTANACKNHLKSFWKQHTEELNDNLVFCDKNDRELWAVVGTLPPKYRAVIHLYYYEGYRQDEIADILGITRTAVQTRMQRARQILEKELNIHG
jgi:RNA polymerase sigma-70 factor (ECF subfamily)